MTSSEEHVIHFKVTESLCRTLENLQNTNYKIRYTDSDQDLKLFISSGSNEWSYQLISEKSNSNYFVVAALHNSNGKFIGPVNKRFRVLADDESFKHAKESLVKEVEENRQQKALKKTVKRKAPSNLHVEQPTKIRREHGRKPEEVKSQVATQHALACVDQSAPLTVSTLHDDTHKPHVPNDSARIKAHIRIECQFVRDRCIEVINERRNFEERLTTVISEPDKSTRHLLQKELQSDLFAFVEKIRNDPLLIRLTPVKSK